MDRTQDMVTRVASDDAGAVNATVSSGGTGAEQTFADSTSAVIHNGDLLRYVGDMVEELECMCARTGCTTLLGLLALARAEALLQQRVGGSRRRAG
jgi:hypothetical protein